MQSPAASSSLGRAVFTIADLQKRRSFWVEPPPGTDSLEHAPIKGNAHYDELMEAPSTQRSTEGGRHSWKGSPRAPPAFSRNRSIVRRQQSRDVSAARQEPMMSSAPIAGSRNALLVAAAEARYKGSPKPHGGVAPDQEPAHPPPSNHVRDSARRNAPLAKDSGRSWRDRSTQPIPNKNRKAQAMYEQAIVQLKTSPNAWKLIDKESQSEISASDAAILVILNKLTPETFMKLSDKAAAIVITRPETLQSICKTMFEKAICEASFASLYAQFIVKLQEKLVHFPDPADRSKTIDVRSEIIKHCYNMLTRPPDMSPLDGLTGPELEEASLMVKRRQLGNVVLMGELFKHGILAESVVHVSVRLMLEGPHADIEALIAFLQTVGKIMERATPAKMDEYFGVITARVKKPGLAPRLRFMLMDVIDLRRNRWRLRREKTVDPKTLDELRKGMAPASSAAPAWTVRIPPKKGSTTGMRPAILKPTWKTTLSSERGSSGRSDIVTKPFSWGSVPLDIHDDESESESDVSDDGAAEDDEDVAAGATGVAVDQESVHDQRAEATVREFYSCLDMDEVLECVRELPATAHRTVVVKAIMIAFDMKDSTRELLRDLLHQMISDSVIAIDDVLGGISTVLKDFEDIAIDLPRAPIFFGNMLGDLLGQGHIDLPVLIEKLQRVETSLQSVGTLALHALGRVADQHGGSDRLLAVWSQTDPTSFKRLFKPKQLAPATFKRSLEASGLLCLPF